MGHGIVQDFRRRHRPVLFRHFRFLVRNSFRLPPFVGLGYFCRLPYPGHRPGSCPSRCPCHCSACSFLPQSRLLFRGSSRQLSVPLLRLVIPAATPIAIPGIVPPCHYPRSHFRSRPGAEPAGRRSVTAARCYRNVFCTGKVCPYGLIFAKAVPPAPLFRPGMAQKR